MNSTCNFQQINNNEGKAENLQASSIEETKARLSYQAKGEQLVEIGVCYGTSRNPTISSGNKKTNYKDEPKDVPIFVSFKVSLSGLEQNTKYYAKAYVINSKNEVTYSDEIEFTTLKEIDFSAMLNGPKIERYPNGQVMKKYQLNDGKINGLYEFYSDSGFLMSRQMMKDGIAEGPLTVYFKNGTVHSITYFHDGLPTGESKEYYQNGSLKTESKYSGDPAKLSGDSKSYFPNGNLKNESHMQDGELISAITYDEQGRVTSVQKPGSIKSMHYDEDGWVHTSMNGEPCHCSRCD